MCLCLFHQFLLLTLSVPYSIALTCFQPLTCGRKSGRIQGADRLLQLSQQDVCGFRDNLFHAKFHKGYQGRQEWHGKRKSTDGLFCGGNEQKVVFLQQYLQACAEWYDSSVGMSENFQKVETPNFYLSNKTKIIKRFAEKHLITFYADNEWENLTSNLDVNFTNQTKGKIYQMNQDHAFFTNEKAQYAFNLSKVQLSLEGGVEGYFRKMDSKADGVAVSVAGEPVQYGDLTTNYLKLFVTPQVEYTLSRFNVDLLCPISYDSYH